jgi:acyl-CoA synthetase (AMP-forming)/AMP-acid ligase II
MTTLITPMRRANLVGRTRAAVVCGDVELTYEQTWDRCRRLSGALRELGLWEGRPMVLMPWGRDQPGVAARAEALGVAEVVQRGDGAEAALASAIERALDSAEMREQAALHAARLHSTDPPRIAANLLEALADG